MYQPSDLDEIHPVRQSIHFVTSPMLSSSIYTPNHSTAPKQRPRNSLLAVTIPSPPSLLLSRYRSTTTTSFSANLPVTPFSFVPGRGMGQAPFSFPCRNGRPDPSSATCLLDAGHGKMCGAPTTRNANTAVEVKREAVPKDLGWRAGGIVCFVVE